MEQEISHPHSPKNSHFQCHCQSSGCHWWNMGCSGTRKKEKKIKFKKKKSIYWDVRVWISACSGSAQGHFLLCWNSPSLGQLHFTFWLRNPCWHEKREFLDGNFLLRKFSPSEHLWNSLNTKKTHLKYPIKHPKICSSSKSISLLDVQPKKNPKRN